MSNSTLVDFNSIKKGDIIILKDRQTIEELMIAKVKNPERGLELTVKKIHRVKSFREKGSKALQVVFNLFYTDKYLVLAKSVEDDIVVRVFFAPDNFQPGNRKDLVESGQEWIFQEPHSSDWTYGDLEYNRFVHNTFDGKPVDFERCGDSYYGESNSKEFTQITEWYGEGAPNPNLLAIETGEDELGGYIEFYMGCEIQQHDYEILNQ